MRTMNVMTASDITTPLAKEEIAAVARRLATATTKGDLLRMLAEEGRYTLADLQVIGGRLFMEVAGLPEPYRSRVRPFFCEQLFGAHHRLLLMYRSGAFRQVGEPIRDRETFEKFCAMIPEGCFPGTNMQRGRRSITPRSTGSSITLWPHLRCLFSIPRAIRSACHSREALRSRTGTGRSTA